MNISVDGLRAQPADWEAVRGLLGDQLPQLTDGQRQVARELGINEEDYARSFLAGRRTTQTLLAKTERFARLLLRRVGELTPRAAIESVVLRTWEEKFDVELQLNGRRVSLRVAEGIVDDLLESGSAEAEEKLSRIVRLALEGSGEAS